MELSEEALTEIGKMPHVYSAVYEDNLLTVRCSGGRHNVIRIQIGRASCRERVY